MGKKVLAFGSFDLLHPGHLFYLNRAKKLGNELAVVVGRDSTIEREKGHKPVMGERDRLEIVKALKPVDHAFLGYKSGEKERVIGKAKPDVVALGHDHPLTKKKANAYLRERGLKAKVVRIPAFKRSRHSSRLKRKKLSLGIDDLFA